LGDTIRELLTTTGDTIGGTTSTTTTSTTSTTNKTTIIGDNNSSGGGGGGGIAIGGFRGVYSEGTANEAFAGLSAADLDKRANSSILVLRDPKRYSKKVVDVCWLAARRIPRIAQAVGVAQQQ